MEGLEVEWKRTGSGKEEALVHLYPSNQPEEPDRNYNGRAHFFTDEIKDGNFSLRLDDLKPEDEGEYTCKVHNQLGNEITVQTNLKLKLDPLLRLQMFLVFCPNILMFLAFIFWGVSEGTVNETVCCCALYFLRPLMLLWAAPYIYELPDNIKPNINHYSFRVEYFVFSAVFYSVLAKSAWDKRLDYSGFKGSMIIVTFGLLLLICLFALIYMLVSMLVKLNQWRIVVSFLWLKISLDLLPWLQFIFLFFVTGSPPGGVFIFAVLPCLPSVTNNSWDTKCCNVKCRCSLAGRSGWLILVLLVNALMVFLCIIMLQNEKDCYAWAFMIGFLQLLWAMFNFVRAFEWALHRCLPVYLFGSVVVVLLNSVTLMTELILKTDSGDRAVGDLTVVVVSSEFVFNLFLLILMVYEPCLKTGLKTCLPSCSCTQNQNRAELHEMRPLLNQDQKDGRRDVTEENQPDSVETRA